MNGGAAKSGGVKIEPTLRAMPMKTSQVLKTCEVLAGLLWGNATGIDLLTGIMIL